jgi:hypothetical protein
VHINQIHIEKKNEHFFLFISILFFPYLFLISSYAPYVYSKLNKIDDFHLIKINKQRKSSQFQLIELNYIYFIYVLRWLWYWPTILFACDFRGSIEGVTTLWVKILMKNFTFSVEKFKIFQFQWEISSFPIFSRSHQRWENEEFLKNFTHQVVFPSSFVNISFRFYKNSRYSDSL